VARRVSQEVDLPYPLQQTTREEILWQRGQGCIKQGLVLLSWSISTNSLECQVVNAYRAYSD
jgi:hypothetical protein